MSARVTMATVEAARSVWSGEVKRASNISGGLHHAMPGYTSGFCVYNDLAIAIHWLLDERLRADRLCRCRRPPRRRCPSDLLGRPAGLTVSLHETPAYLFPGTGFPHEIGGRGAEGTAVNVALPPGTGDAGWLRAFHAIVPRCWRRTSRRSWSPSTAATRTPMIRSRTWSSASMGSVPHISPWRAGRRICGGRWVSMGGGGYALLDVVPRAWTHLLAIVSGEPVDPATRTPQAWRDEIGPGAPLTMTDGADARLRDVRPQRPSQQPGRPGHHRHPSRGLPRAGPGYRDLLSGLIGCVPLQQCSPTARGTGTAAEAPGRRSRHRLPRMPRFSKGCATRPKGARQGRRRTGSDGRPAQDPVRRRQAHRTACRRL